MLLYVLFHRMFRSVAAAALSLLLAVSGCTAQDAISVSTSEAVEVSMPEGFLLAELGKEAICRGDLILVNGETPYRFLEEPVLQKVCEGKNGSYFIRSTDLLLAPDALAAVNAMLSGFLEQGGSKTVNLVAAWRSAASQQILYDHIAAQVPRDLIPVTSTVGKVQNDGCQLPRTEIYLSHRGQNRSLG